MSEVNYPAHKTLSGSKGQTLRWRRMVDFVRNTPSPRVMPPNADECCSVLDLSAEDLANALSPVVLKDGHEYIGEPSLESRDWMTEPVSKPGPFDFGDAAHFQKGLDFFSRGAQVDVHEVMRANAPLGLTT